MIHLEINDDPPAITTKDHCCRTIVNLQHSAPRFCGVDRCSLDRGKRAAIFSIRLILRASRCSDAVSIYDDTQEAVQPSRWLKYPLVGFACVC
jgi:hypothetical protein